ncbi:TPA: hypothetical protein HA278_02405 [Candidatus Woesearchaeota archaeon]|nr:hypothetical protein [Candidatus Woesearchaeota archaeon]
MKKEVRMTLHLVRDIKDIGRFKEILTVLLQEGLGYYLGKSKLKSHLPWHHRVKPTLPINQLEDQAVRIRKACEKLGPTFVKLGQLLSLRPDLVPHEYSAELEKLQDTVPSFSYSKAKKIIEADLGKPIDKLFKSFEKKPFASASIAQVHKAVLYNGKKVAVKVRRPGIETTINEDLDILFFIAHKLEKHIKKLRRFRPTQVVKEFALWTRRELNLVHEATAATRLKELLKDNDDIIIPFIYKDHSSKRVLTMELIEGVKLDDFTQITKWKVSRKKLANIYFLSILEQALLHGFFHADPHPANIFVNKKGKLIFLDFGIMGELSIIDRKKVIKFINSIPEEDAEKSFAIIASLAKKLGDADMAAFKQDALPLLLSVYNQSLQDESIGNALYKVMGMGAKHGVVFDPNHILMAKAIYQAEGLGLMINPSFKVADGLHDFAEEYLEMEFSPKNIALYAQKMFYKNKNLLEELPEHILNIIHRLENPQPDQLSQTQLHELEQKIEDTHSFHSKSLLVVVLSVLFVFLLYMEGRTHILGIPLSIIVFGVLVVVLGYNYLKKRGEEGWKQE